jgi:hypothetical protein
VRLTLAGSARVAIAAVSIGLGAAACGAADGPAAERSDPPAAVDASEPGNPPATAVADPGLSEAEVTELEQQLDEIDRVLADLEVQLSED